jgi:hypothetical protein
MKLGGMIYLHDISESRMGGAGFRNLEMFQKLCGEDALDRVILGTTKWEILTPEAGQKRECYLKETFWKGMLESGSKAMRFTGPDHASAISIVHKILEGFNRAAENKKLAIQKELVDLQQYLPQTEAGQNLFYSLKTILEMQENIPIYDSEHRKELEAKKKVLKKQLKALKLPFMARFLAFFGL